MAKQTYINGDPQLLKKVLEESGYFDSVTIKSNEEYESYALSSLITCTTKSGEHTAVLRIGQKSSDAEQFVIFYENSNGIKEVWGPSKDSGGPTYWKRACPDYAYQCSGGLSLVLRYGRMIITRNQNGETVIALTTKSFAPTFYTSGSYSLSDNTPEITAYATSDVRPVVRYTTNLTISNQTLPIPFCTTAAFGAASYTVTAFWLTNKQSTAIGNIVYNGKRYFSDGYFALEDLEEDA